MRCKDCIHEKVCYKKIKGFTEGCKENNKKTYRIENCGCDDETVGTVELTEKEFNLFNRVFAELNKNSKYSCMPTIYIDLTEEVNDDL